MKPMRTLVSMRNYIKGFERFESKAYLCPAGVWTIAFGATYYENGESVKEGDTISRIKGELLFNYHIAICENVLYSIFDLPIIEKLNVYQFSSLVSLVYNIGSGNFNKSNVARNIKEGNMIAAADSFMDHVYVYDRKKKIKRKLKGLVLRRSEERRIYITPEEIIAIRKRLSIQNIQTAVLNKWYNHVQKNRFIMPKYINP